MKLVRVDMTQGKIDQTPIPAMYDRLGGRALTSKLMLEEVTPTCDALGPHNKLIFAPGLLAGVNVTTAGRLSVGSKSPLTGGIKEANAGGTAGDTLAKLGVKAIIVEGQAKKGEWYLLHITEDAIELLPADDVRGLGTYATADKLQERFGADSSIISIGQGGEH